MIGDTLREARRVLAPGLGMIHLDVRPQEDEVLTWLQYGHGRRTNEPYMERLAKMGIGAAMARIGFGEVAIAPFEEMDGAFARTATHWRVPWAVISATKPAGA